MNFIVRVHFCAVIVLFLCLTYLQSLRTNRMKRIVGGTPIACGIQPRAVSLRDFNSGQHICGAAIVSKEYALTAAHCVHGPPSQYILQLRNFCIADNETYPVATVVDIITHDNYNEYTREHDLSILQITLELDDVTWLNEPLLPISSFGLSSDCTIYGYGTMDPTSEDVSESLLAGRVQTVSLDQCIDRLGPYVAPAYDSGMMCALGDQADACQGDSGGPLICDDSFLQGISSYGQSCGVDGLPGVYTSIGAHLSWINDVIHQSTKA